MLESEVQESAQVEHGSAGGERESVAFDAAVADAAVAVGDEPCDGALDEGSVLPIAVGVGAVAPLCACCGEVMVVVADGEGLAVGVGGAS